MDGACRGLAGGNSRRLRDGNPDGIPRRRPEQSIGADELRASLAAVQTVTDEERAELASRAGHPVGFGRRVALGPCGQAERPMGAVRSGQGQPTMRGELGFRERLVSLQELLDGVGYRRRITLKRHYTTKCLDGMLGNLVLPEGGRGDYTL